MDMNMNMTQWPGTLEEREQLRAQLIGKAWVSAWRAAPGKYADWIPVIRERTRLRDRWLWSPRHLEDKTFDESRAQVAGDALLSALADGSQGQLSASWFNTAAQTDEWADGWLFDEECLRADGWDRTTGQTMDGKAWRGWRRRTPGS